MLESLFNKIAGLKACNFIKKKLQHRYFTVNIGKFLRAPVPKHASRKRSVLGFAMYFLTSSAFRTLVPPNLYLLLRLSRLLNISNVSYSNSLNKLNGLSPYQKIVPNNNA